MGTTTYNAQSDITLYNRGPFTTSTALPVSCYDTITQGPNSLWYAGHFSTSYVDDNCFPSSTSTISDPIKAWVAYYYSPAVSCPSGWNTAATLTSYYHGFSVALSIGSETTALLCCPSGYVSLAFDHECQSFISGTETITYIKPTTDALGNFVSTDVVFVTTTTRNASLAAVQVQADAIPIFFQSSDLVQAAKITSASSSASITSTNTSTGTGSIAAQTSGSVSPTSTSTSSGLSSGAKIGVGVGVALAVVAILAALGAYALYIRRKRRLHYQQAQLDSDQAEPKLAEYSDVQQPPELSNLNDERFSEMPVPVPLDAKSAANVYPVEHTRSHFVAELSDNSALKR